MHGRQTADFSKLTYRAVLDRQFTPDILGYVSWNTGFKSGQYSLVGPLRLRVFNQLRISRRFDKYSAPSLAIAG